MKQAIKLGGVDYSVLVFIPDPASTDGSGKTGLNAAALTVSYTRLETDNDVIVTDVTSSLNDLSALTDTHNDWGVKEVSSTLAPGLYRLDLADAVLATGIWSAVVYVMITTSAAAASPMEFIAVAYDPLDATSLGISRIDAAITSRASQTSLDTVDDFVDTEVAAIKTQTDKLVFTVANHLDVNVLKVAGTSQTAGDIVALINAVDDFVDTEVAAIKAKTDNLPSDPADASDIAGAFSTVNSTLATIATYVDTEVAAIKAKTDLIPGTQDGLTFAQMQILFAAVLLGKASGLGTTTAVYRSADDGEDRVTATVDADGNRTAVTLNSA